MINTATAGSGFTALSLVNGDLDEFQIQSAAGNVAAIFNQPGGGVWLALLITVRPTPVTDSTPPVISITAPSPGASVFGTIVASANPTDNVAVAGVQFRLDGSNLGTEVTMTPYSISWDTTAVADGSHTLTASARDVAGNTSISSPVVVNVTNGVAVTGQWSTTFDLGLVAVNAVMMHTGKVLLFSGSFQSSWTERVWDPATGAIALVPNPYYNLFCSGQAQLADGRILIVGGYDPPSLGAANANIFDPVTQSWSALPNMAYRRWYPTATTLPDGRMLVTSGGQSCLTCLADLPEIFDPATGKFSTLSTARLAVPYYPFMFVLPDGKVIDAGANEQAVATSKLNVSSGMDDGGSDCEDGPQRRDVPARQDS